MVMSSCSWCNASTTTICSGCEQVYYCSPDCQRKDWKEGGHKIICKDLPRAIAKAEALIATRSLASFTPRPYSDQSEEEWQAQELCYDAMEIKPGDSPRKIALIIQALNTFPFSIEAWGLLGAHFRHHVPKERRDYQRALRMCDIALRCARKINPDEWSEDRQERLEYGIVENRPYFRALLGRALALREMGEIKSAIKAAKKILKWNPNDNQGVRSIVCNWMLEDGDTEGCLNILRSYDEVNNPSLAYSDVLLQFLRWKKEDVLEEDVQKSLYRALKSNLYIPDLLLIETIEEKKIEYLDGDGPITAQQYAQDAHALWRANPGAIEWLASQKFDGNVKVPPSEMDLITILRKGPVAFVRCKNTDLNGRDEKTSTLRVTQKRAQCLGNALPDFYWPSALNRAHLVGDAIFMFHHGDAEHLENLRDYWRKATYSEIKEVPFWKILVHFSKEEE